MDFVGTEKLWENWTTRRMSKEVLQYGQLAGTQTLTMSEPSFFERLSAYVAENKRQAAVEAATTNVAGEATTKATKVAESGANLNSEPTDEQVQGEKFVKSPDIGNGYSSL